MTSQYDAHDEAVSPNRMEQGLAIWQVSDYEDIAAETKDEAVAFAVREWGYDSPEQAEKNDAFDPAEVFAVDLDARQVNINEDEDPAGPILTYREHLKALIATGQKFPMFFAGRE